MSGRSFSPGDAWSIVFSVNNSTGAAANADALPTVRIVRNGALDSAVTLTVVSLEAGVYVASGTLPATYAVGDRVSFLLTATVGGVVTKDVLEVIRLVISTQPPTTLAFLNASGLTTLYAVLRDVSNRVYNNSTSAYEAYTAANYANYAIALTEQGATGFYAAAVPSAAQATLGSIDFRQRAGTSAAPGDAQKDSTASLIATGGSVTVAGYAAGQDPLSLLQASADWKALLMGPLGTITGATYPSGAGSAVIPVTYGSLTKTATLTLDSAGNVTARTVA